MTVEVTVGIPTFNRAPLLREAISSVLDQSYRDFRLLISDNASEDDTESVVASFADPRIEYVRSTRNVGIVANFDRLIRLSKTKYLLVLPDDDLLYPNHIAETFPILEEYANVGVVHTGFDIIDGGSRVLERGRNLIGSRNRVTVETGAQYLKRSMSSPWTMCLSSALFRTRALVEAGGYRVEDAHLADFPLLMRVALNWDFAALQDSLAAFRVHANAATAALGSYTGAGYSLLDTQPQVLHEHRMRFLEESGLSTHQTTRYKGMADRAFCQGTVVGLAAGVGSSAISWSAAWKGLGRIIWAEPRTLLVPATWRLFAAQMGGRYAKRVARRLKGSPGT